jgi:hypothetical protein
LTAKRQGAGSNMNTRKTIALFLFVAAIAAAGYLASRLADREPAYASGPLTEALLAAHEPGETTVDLSSIFDEFIDNRLPIEERVPLLEQNGFFCHITDGNDSGYKSLRCQRPVESTDYCQGFAYVVLMSGTGEILSRIGDGFTEPEGRCAANDPARR